MHLTERFVASLRRHGMTASALVSVALAVLGCHSLAYCGAKELFAKYEQQCIAGGFKKITVKVGGLDRQVLWKAPSGGAWRRGAVVALHGGGGTYSNYCANLRIGKPQVDFGEQVVKNGYALFLPDSTDTLAKDDAGNSCGKRWDSLDHPGENQDVRFLEDLIKATIPGLRPPSSSQDVFLTGISNGGFMSILAATKVPELVTAVAPVSAGDPYSTALDCSAKASSAFRSTPGIFVDRGTKKSIAEDAACQPANGGDPTLAKGPRPPMKFLYHESDGGVDISCKAKAMARLTRLGFPEDPPFVIKGSGGKSVFKHLWQDEYNGPLLKFLESHASK